MKKFSILFLFFLGFALAQHSSPNTDTSYTSMGYGYDPSNYEISLGTPTSGYKTDYTGTVEPWRIYNPELLIIEGTPLANLLQLAWDMQVYGYPQEALQTYLIILERYPHNYEAHNALGAYYRELGDWQNARAAYNNAFTYTISAEAKNNIGYILSRMDRDSRWGIPGVNAFEAGYASFEKGDYNSAVNYFSEVTRLAPNWLEGRYWLAKSYLRLGHYNAARDGLNYVLQAENDPYSEIYQGAYYLLSTF